MEKGEPSPERLPFYPDWLLMMALRSSPYLPNCFVSISATIIHH